jgi:putative two-component system response regulator
MRLSQLKPLDEMLQRGRALGDPEIKVALSRLNSDLRHLREKGSPLSREVFLTSLRSLRQIRGSMHADLRMECLNHCAQYFYANGPVGDALRAATELLHVSQLVQNKEWLRISENLSAVFKADLGNVPDAVAHHCRAIELARELQNSFAEISYRINLGVTLNYAGLYREAILCFKSAERLSRNSSATRCLAVSAAANLAQSHLALDELREGFDVITVALGKSHPPDDSASALARTVREWTFVQLALELGSFGEARRHTALCMKFANQSGCLRSTILAEGASGLCEIYCGDIDRGLAVLEKAFERTESNTALRTDALTTLVKAYDKAGRPADALNCLRKLLEHIKVARERSLLALLSSPFDLSSDLVHAEHMDLRALHFREAKLRAQVAESELLSSQIEMLERLAVTADLREEPSGQHGYRVGRLAYLVGAALGWNHSACYSIEMAARLHDIGKIAVPDRILFASEDLKEAERELMCAHTVFGAELLSKSNQTQLRLAQQIAYQHHEWWNGQGYPMRLSGKRISLPARIVALSDVFDALTHGRPYSGPWSIESALQEIRSRSGTQFDPELTDIFVALVTRLRAEDGDLDAKLGDAASSTPFFQARERIRQMLSAERAAMAPAEGLALH